jgi:nicotinamide-nucleotide amidase
VTIHAGILVTGTEVLTGRVVDRNGPWCSERLRELGIEHETTVVVGDRPADMAGALEWLRNEGCALIVTSGGLGPTADDLTAEVIGRFQGREMVVDEELEGRIAAILERATRRWPNVDLDAIRAGNRKQATIPEGSTVLEPVGTAPGLVVPPTGGEGPTVLVLPGPPRELKPMWEVAVATKAFRDAVSGRTEIRQEMMRLFGIPESEIAETLRLATGDGIALDGLEITTCMRRGEIEIVTRYEPASQPAYEAFSDFVASRHADTLFSTDGSSVDVQVAALLREQTMTISVAESCTGGLMAGRLTEQPGASEYVAGGVVAYSNEAKCELVGVSEETIDSCGAVSPEVALELAAGIRGRLSSDIGVGITGIAGPAGGSEEKPVGLVCFAVSGSDGSVERSIQLPGSRDDVRDRSTTVAMHLVRAFLEHGPKTQ